MAYQYVQAATAVWGVVSSVFDGKDDDRKRANEAAYQAALNGDANALLFLKQRTGNYGTAFVPGYGSIGGWATAEAKADAQQKYSAALAALDAQQSVAGFGSTVQGIAQQTGHTIVPGTKENVTLILVAGGAIIAVLAVAAARRKRAA